MILIKEIRECFASLPTPGAKKLAALPKEYPAYAIRIPEGYGIAVAVNNEMEVSENFNSIKLYTGYLSINGVMRNYLILRSAFEEYRYEFASICAEFADPGGTGENRALLLENPCTWWTKWKELVGNTNRDQQVYNVIAEMMVLNHKLKTDHSAEWTASRMSSHDIECAEESCEVKSTIKRYGCTATISGQHQLEHRKPLFLYFCRLEESLEGVSINEMKTALIENGYNEGKLELELVRLGFERGANIRNKRYKALERRKYIINEQFPQIVQSSFKGGRYPAGIVHIEYTVDLDGLNYTEW